MKIRKEKFYVFEECFQGTWKKKSACYIELCSKRFSVLHQFYFDFYFDAEESVT